MRLRILKSLLSIYGAMVPGMRITVPAHIGRNWVENGIAEEVDEDGHTIGVEVPEGMFWCRRHEGLHKIDSRSGRKCYERQLAEDTEAEEEKAAAEKAAEAELAAAEEEVEEEEEEAEEEEDEDEDEADDSEGDDESGT